MSEYHECIIEYKHCSEQLQVFSGYSDPYQNKTVKYGGFLPACHRAAECVNKHKSKWWCLLHFFPFVKSLHCNSTLHILLHLVVVVVVAAAAAVAAVLLLCLLSCGCGSGSDVQHLAQYLGHGMRKRALGYISTSFSF